MDDIKDNIVISPDELKADEEIQKGVTDDELREKVIADFGLNSDENKDLIDKLVADKKANHEKLSAAIKQKINYRNQAISKPAGEKGGSLKPEDVDALIDQRLADRELSDLELPDELKTEIKDLAKFKGISVREATKIPYIQSKISEIKKESRVLGATPVRINSGGKTISIDPSKALDPSQFDLSTTEGQTAWKEAKKAREDYRKSH